MYFTNVIRFICAFDTVDHAIFLRRLNFLYSVDGAPLNWFKSYFNDRDHRVFVHEALSPPRVITCGVPQGSVLRARLYTMYIYPLTQIIQRHDIQYHTYADDIQLLYMKCHRDDNSIIKAITQLQNCIADITEWMSNNTLNINEIRQNLLYLTLKVIVETNLQQRLEIM